MARIETTVTVSNVYEYSRPSYSGWKLETAYIYTFTDDAGIVYVWKTTTFAGYEEEDPAEGWIIRKGKRYSFYPINTGDVITIRATVKGRSEYKGQPQVEVNRVTVLSRSFKAKTREEIQAEREAERERQKEEQLSGIDFESGDRIWRQMPYRQYKEHYSDCETIIDSYMNTAEGKFIDVIIRAGRLKASGTRGKHYSGYQFEWTQDGEKHLQVFYAISEETALRRLRKENPGAENIEAGHVFEYYREH